MSVEVYCHEILCVLAKFNGTNTVHCRYDRREIAYSLIDNGARIDICNQLGHYPIHYAAHNNDNLLVTTLVQKGQDPQSRTLLGMYGSSEK